MGTLSRDVDAYQRALAVYQRRANSYNNSIVKDANGNPYLIAKGDYDPVSAYATPNGLPNSAFKVADSKTGKVSAAQGNVDFVGATDNGDPNFLLLRQNPRGQETKTLEGARFLGDALVVSQDIGGEPSYLTLDPSKVRAMGQPDENGSFAVQYDVPTFAESPGEFNMKAPNPSTAEIRRDQRPSVAAQEGGLIGEVLASRGLKSSGSFPGKRGAINKAREDRAAATKLEEEKLAAEKARLAAEADQANAGPSW